MGIIVVVMVVLFLVLAIFRPDLVTRGFLAAVEVPKTILGNSSPKELPPPVFDEVTDEEYYELVKRNASDWVADAELVATEQFDADEVKAHKIEASYLKEACACDICLTPKPKSISVMNYYNQQKADKITIVPQPHPDRTWLSYDGDDKDSYYENYGNYSVFHDMTNRTPRTSHEIGVARKLQQFKESTDQDTIRSIDGTVVATKITQFSDEAHRILRWGGIAPFRPEDSLGYDPRLW